MVTPFEKHGISKKEKRPVILGTDWWTDCDDCVAVRILCRAHKEGIIDLKGISIDACMEKSVPSLHSFICAEGAGQIPIGIDLQGTDFAGTIGKNAYQYVLADRGDGSYKSNSEAEDAVRLYRKILAEAEEKVDIIEVGFMQVLAQLLKSGSDDISEKTGKELVKEKVNALWAMAGKWDTDKGGEHNFNNNHRSIAGGQYVCDNWCAPIVFLGFEIGETVITGGNGVLKGADDVLRIAMQAHGSERGRCSWDPMTAVLMLCGIENAGYEAVYGKASLDSNGLNSFTEDKNGSHCYVKKLKDDKWYEDFINDLIR